MATTFPFRPTMQKVFWKDVRNQVHEVAPEFATLVDTIDPSKDYPLYKACYPYGSTIVKEGVCYYPNRDGKLVTLFDNSLDPDIQKNLGYTKARFPVGLVLQNSIELSLISKTKEFPRNIHSEGYVFALWHYLEKTPAFHPCYIFNITSGAQSIFLLPNIGHATCHNNIRREFNIKVGPPKDIPSQRQIFTAILNHPNAKCDWHSTLLFFSAKWLQKIMSDDKKWLLLSRNIYKNCWQNSAFNRNKMFYDFIFSQIQSVRHLRPNPYIADTVKHLFTIAFGALPGFAAATDNSKAPIDLLQKIYLEIYGLKNYAPTFMQPEYFSFNKPTQVYYSLTLPTSLEFSPHCRKDRTALIDIRELAYLIQVYLEEINKGYLNIEGTPLPAISNTIKFDFYHDKFDREGFTKSTAEMPKADPTLINCPVGYKNNTFPVAAPFIRGCAKISHKN